MESNWAAENLQTIRTLMERSALYRHALAPIMLFAGVIGVLATAIGFDSASGFAPILWRALVGSGDGTIAGAFFIIRRQALKNNEPFWSPPTRRVAMALVPPLTGRDDSGRDIHSGSDGLADVDFTLLLPFFGRCFMAAPCTRRDFLCLAA